MIAKAFFVHTVTLCGFVSVASGDSAGNPALSTTAACVGFGEDFTADVGWRFADCLDVWASWNRSLADHDLPRIDGNFFTTVAERHRAGSFPCQVGSKRLNDGAGSRTMRYLSDWIFARQLGCVWIGPEEGGVDGPDPSQQYCHSVVRNETSNPHGTSPDDPSARCSFVKWLEFFNLEQHMPKSNISGEPRDIYVSIPMYFGKLQTCRGHLCM